MKHSELVLVLDLDLVTLRQVPQSLRVGEMLVFHQEPHGISRFPAAETLKDPLGGGNGKGGRFLVVERTEAKVIHTPSLQHDEVADHIFDARRR